MSRHLMQSHTYRVHACLAVTCRLHFGQTDQDVLRATAVTRGWNGYRKKVDPGEENLPPHQPGLEPRPFDHEPGALTTELSALPVFVGHLWDIVGRMVHQRHHRPPNQLQLTAVLQQSWDVRDPDGFNPASRGPLRDDFGLVLSLIHI